MTVQLSLHKIGKILRGYFLGIPQPKIAKQAGVDQSTVSHYASSFKKMAEEVGVIAAGKEFEVMNEVEILRSLSVELFKSKMTVEDARQGLHIIKAFQGLGISSEEHLNLIKVCKEVNISGFVQAALKLIQIESQTGKKYDQVISNFESVLIELPQLEKKYMKKKAVLESIDEAILQNKQKIANQEKQLEKYQIEAKTKVEQTEKEVAAKMKQLSIDKEKVEEVATLMTKLASQGLDLDTLLKLGKEF